MPPEGLINIKFLRDVFLGKKRLFKDAEVTRVNVARFKELSGKVALEFVLSDPHLRVYLPEHWSDGKKISREYLWLIIGTMRFDFV